MSSNVGRSGDCNPKDHGSNPTGLLNKLELMFASSGNYWTGQSDSLRKEDRQLWSEKVRTGRLEKLVRWYTVIAVIWLRGLKLFTVLLRYLAKFGLNKNDVPLIQLILWARHVLQNCDPKGRILIKVFPKCIYQILHSLQPSLRKTILQNHYQV